MYQNKIYRVTWLIKELLTWGSIEKSDWEYLGMNPEMDNKTILRDVAEIKRLMKDIHYKELVYNRKDKRYEI